MTGDCDKLSLALFSSYSSCIVVVAALPRNWNTTVDQLRYDAGSAPASRCHVSVNILNLNCIRVRMVNEYSDSPCPLYIY